MGAPQHERISQYLRPPTAIGIFHDQVTGQAYFSAGRVHDELLDVASEYAIELPPDFPAVLVRRLMRAAHAKEAA